MVDPQRTIVFSFPGPTCPVPWKSNGYVQHILFTIFSSIKTNASYMCVLNLANRVLQSKAIKHFFLRSSWKYAKGTLYQCSNYNSWPGRFCEWTVLRKKRRQSSVYRAVDPHLFLRILIQIKLFFSIRIQIRIQLKN